MNGIPVWGYGAVAAIVGAVLWRYKKLHRFSATFFALGAFLLALGILPWQEALATLTATGTGLVILLAVDIVAGIGFWFEAICQHMHHRVRTPVLALTFGTAAVMTFANGARLLREAATSPRRTANALAQSMTRIRSGHAGGVITAHRAVLMLAGVVAGLVILIVAAHRMERHSAVPTPKLKPLAITSGRSSRPARALPAGNSARPVPAPSAVPATRTRPAARP